MFGGKDSKKQLTQESKFILNLKSPHPSLHKLNHHHLLKVDIVIIDRREERG